MLPILDVGAAVDGLDRVSTGSDLLSGWQIVSVVAIVFGCLAVFGIPVMLTVLALRHRMKRQSMINDLVMKLAEKGQPVPPELFVQEVKQKSDLRRGVMWASIGLGMVCWGAVAGNDMMGIGFIPLMIGIGFAMAAWLENKQKQSP